MNKPSQVRWMARSVPLLLAAGCIAESESLPTEQLCPTAENFPIVSQVVERRCGTLDCHGDGSRSLRIYGRTGLRKPREATPGHVPGGLVATTAEEVQSTYLSICGLQPELMNDVTQNKTDPSELLILRKGRLVESHKGGQVLVEGAAGDRCIYSWLDGVVDTAACNEELLIP